MIAKDGTEEDVILSHALSIPISHNEREKDCQLGYDRVLENRGLQDLELSIVICEVRADAEAENFLGLQGGYLENRRLQDLGLSILICDRERRCWINLRGRKRDESGQQINR